MKMRPEFATSLSQEGRDALKGYAAALTVAVIWSGFNIISRLGGQGPFNGFDLAALRFGVSGLVLLPVFVRLRFRAGPRQLTALATIGGLGYSLTVYSGFRYAPAVDAGVLVNGGIPFAATFLGWLILGLRPARHTLVALACSGAGIVLLACQGLRESAAADGMRWFGDLLFVAAAVCYAAFGILLRRWEVRPLEAISAIAVLSMGAYVPLYAWVLPGALGQAPLSEILVQGFYQGLLVACGATLLFAYAVSRIGPVRASVMMAVVPAITAVAAIPLLGEPAEIWTLLGVAMVTLGAILGTMPRKSRHRE
ncbi:MAG: Permease of the drug/metabolite transporter superfamily [Rhodocyclaceae bacterium]|nr:Permease of the drug/metabolite transporter superfamily [Rhodocyclaceae bacterium]